MICTYFDFKNVAMGKFYFTRETCICGLHISVGSAGLASSKPLGRRCGPLAPDCLFRVEPSCRDIVNIW